MTAWASYRFDDIHSMIKSVDAGALRGLGERWRAAADLIKRNAANLANETEKLHKDWRSPKAADLFQSNVAKSVARMAQWERAADRKAGTLSQAATDVLASQSEMDKLKAERAARLAAATTEAEKQAVEREFDQLARAEGQRIGGKLAGLAAWQPPAPYTGLIGLAPKGIEGGTVVFGEEFDVDRSPTGTEVVDPSPTDPIGTKQFSGQEFPPAGPSGGGGGFGDPAGGHAPGFPAVLPPLAGAVPTSPLTAGGAAAGQAAVGRLAGFGGRAATALNGYMPSGLFGRMAGAVPGALAPGGAGAGGSGFPLLPPQGAGLAGRLTRTRRPAPKPLPLEQAPVPEQAPSPSEPAAVSGRPTAVGKAATPREVLVPGAGTADQSGAALGQ